MSQAEQCDMFKSEHCSIRKEVVLLVDNKISSAAECQSACFDKSACVEFTFFRGKNSRCVLFKVCRKPKSSCKNCISGPVFPRVGSCPNKLQQQRKRGQGRARNEPKKLKGQRQVKQPQSPGFCVVCVLASGGINKAEENDGKNNERDVRESLDDEENVDYSGDYTEDYQNNEDENIGDDDIPSEDNEDTDMDYEEIDKEETAQEEEVDDEVNVDDGLLDNVFEELPEDTKDDEQSPKDKPQSTKDSKRPSKPQNKKTNEDEGKCPSCACCYYCMMGGANANGAVSAVSVMNIGTYSLPSRRLISPFPPFMLQGSGRTFSMYSSNSLLSCTPGYQISTLDLRTGHIQSSFIPGSCNNYDFLSRQWTSTGGKLTDFRSGGSTVSVGSYIMSLGGVDRLGQRLTAVELFDPRRPGLGWQNVPQWSFPRATADQCTVATRDPELGSSVMVMGGLGELYSAMKLVLATNNWYSVSPMNHPRSQHGCTSVTLNGRRGVVVSGGVDDNNFNTTSVEFYDMRTNKWINLPSLSRGRRGHTMATIDGQLVVAGGESTGLRGEDEFLDDVEVFDGKKWKRADYKLDQPRTGANLVKIPISIFRNL